MSERTQSSLQVATPPEKVLGIIADFEAYPQWASTVSDVRVLSTDAQGRAQQVRFHMAAGTLTDEYTLAYQWNTAPDGSGTISWNLVSASLVDDLHGSYTLAPTDSGGTHVTYQLSVQSHMPMVGLLRRKAEKTIIDTALHELKRHAEA